MAAIEGDAALSTSKQQLHPEDGRQRECHCLHASQHPGPVQAVVGLEEIKEDDAARQLLLPHVINLLKVQQHVVCCRPAWHKRCLRVVDDAAEAGPNLLTSTLATILTSHCSSVMGR